MDVQIRRKQILVEMAQIDSMEKERLTEEYRDSYKDGKTIRLGLYFKYQRWKDGKNISRRIPAPKAGELRKAVEGYHRFESLAKEYVQLTGRRLQGACADR